MMKAVRRCAILAVLLVGVPGPARAQLSVGVQGGVTWAAPVLDAFNSDIRAGSIAGGFVRLPVIGRASVQIEAMYTMKGFANIGFLTDAASARIPYLDVPVFFKLVFGASDARLRPTIMAGPYWGIELGCSTQGDIVELEGSDSCDGRFRGRGTADVGFIGAGGLELDVSDRWFLILDDRFHLGLRNLHFDPESDRSRSRGWSVMGGVGVEIGG